MVSRTFFFRFWHCWVCNAIYCVIKRCAGHQRETLYLRKVGRHVARHIFFRAAVTICTDPHMVINSRVTWYPETHKDAEWCCCWPWNEIHDGGSRYPYRNISQTLASTILHRWIWSKKRERKNKIFVLFFWEAAELLYFDKCWVGTWSCGAGMEN